MKIEIREWPEAKWDPDNFGCRIPTGRTCLVVSHLTATQLAVLKACVANLLCSQGELESGEGGDTGRDCAGSPSP